MNKCISFGSSAQVLPATTPDPNDFKAGQPTQPGGPVTMKTQNAAGVLGDWTMVQELKDMGVTFVRFWVSWFDLAQAFRTVHGRNPASFAEQAQFMEASRGFRYPQARPMIEYLDEWIKLANDNDFTVILTVEQDAPTWSWTDRAIPDIWANAEREPGTRKEVFRHFPVDMGATSPYGWFIQYLLARYTGETTGGPGCGCVPARGNPKGARISAIEPINEPNFAWWPQAEAEPPPPGPPTSYTTMAPICSAQYAMTTCEWWCRFYSPHYGYMPFTLGPATADKREAFYCPPGAQSQPECDTLAHGGSTDWTLLNAPYEQFTSDVLGMLREWEPVAPVRWSHHNYKDIDFGTDDGVTRVLQLLAEKDFLGFGLATRPRDVWLTEGASRMDGYYQTPLDANGQPIPETPGQREGRLELRQAEQAALLETNLTKMRDHPGQISLWTHHVVMDKGTEATSYAIRDTWVTNSDGSTGPGPKRDAWHVFKQSPNLPVPLTTQKEKW